MRKVWTWGFVAVVLFAFGAVLSDDRSTEGVAVVFLAAGFVPAAVAAWNLLLVMTRQVSRAIRDDDED